MPIKKTKLEQAITNNLMSKTTKSLLCLCFVLSYQLSFAQTNGFIDKGKYEVKKHKSVSGSTYITLEAFERENPANRFHAAYHVNKIIFVPDKVGPLRSICSKVTLALGLELSPKSGSTSVNSLYRKATPCMLKFT
jgi:hypothetical protein